MDKHLIRLINKIITCLFFLFVLLSSKGIIYPQEQPIRTITIKIAADQDVQNRWISRMEIKRYVKDVSKMFEKRFGIRFKIKKYENWYSNCSSDYLFDLLTELRYEVPNGDCDIVLGITSKYPVNCSLLGIANYLTSYVLVREISSKNAMKMLLWHEFCHLFGGVDLKEKGSIMDTQRRGYEFDQFTSEIILVNKHRNFNPHEFPLSTNKLEKAISLYQHREKLQQGEVGLNVFLAALYLEKGKSESALNECYKALQLNPNSKEIHNLCGIALRQSNRLDQAIAEYQKVKQSRHDFPETHFNLGIAYMKKGWLKKSIEEYKKAIELNPHYSEAHANLGYVYLKLGKIELAIEESCQALEIYPELAEAYCTLGAAWGHKNELNKAEALCRKALELNPDLAEAHNNLAGISLAKGGVDDALQEYKTAIKIKPDCLSAHLNLGILYFDCNLLEDSAFHLRRAIEINPDFCKAYQKLAQISFQQKRYSTSWDYIKKAENCGIETITEFKEKLMVRLSK